MKAKSIKGKSAQEIQSSLKQSMSDGFKPTFAVFIFVKQNRAAVWGIFEKGNIDVIGATSANMEMFYKPMNVLSRTLQMNDYIKTNTKILEV